MTMYKRADTLVSMTDPNVCPICYSRMPMGGDISIAEHIANVHPEWSKVEEEKKAPKKKKVAKKVAKKSPVKKSSSKSKAKPKKKKGKK